MSTTFDSIDGATSRALVGGVEAFRFNSSGIISGGMAGFRNRIINGNLAVNQRVVSGAVTLAAGAYGHDRFKAGVGGCTYTFAASANGMMLTITAGTLLQIIEGANLEGGAMKLSWFGTATGRVDTGAYGASGVVGTAVAGTNQSVEFGTGTLARVQYELGGIATVFEQRPIELILCQRYLTTFTLSNMQMYAQSSGNYNIGYSWFPVQMRASPTITATNLGYANASAWSASSVTVNNYFNSVTAAAAGNINLSGTFFASAEL